ncbi:hypothetical protein IMSAG025_01069 [Muribaculaceae bacterium]|nr:hypothetical protein IMSAG025_01069 [Muribaculaceae bacterium]
MKKITDKKLPLWTLLISLLVGMLLGVIAAGQFVSKENISTEEGVLMRPDEAVQEAL